MPSRVPAGIETDDHCTPERGTSAGDWMVVRKANMSWCPQTRRHADLGLPSPSHNCSTCVDGRNSRVQTNPAGAAVDNCCRPWRSFFGVLCALQMFSRTQRWAKSRALSMFCTRRSLLCLSLSRLRANGPKNQCSAEAVVIAPHEETGETHHTSQDGHTERQGERDDNSSNVEFISKPLKTMSCHGYFQRKGKDELPTGRCVGSVARSRHSTSRPCRHSQKTPRPHRAKASTTARCFVHGDSLLGSLC